MREVMCFVSESSRVSSIFFPHGLQYSLGLGRRGEAKEGGWGADEVMVRTVTAGTAGWSTTTQRSEGQRHARIRDLWTHGTYRIRLVDIRIQSVHDEFVMHQRAAGNMQHLSGHRMQAGRFAPRPAQHQQ